MLRKRSASNIRVISWSCKDLYSSKISKVPFGLFIHLPSWNMEGRRQPPFWWVPKIISHLWILQQINGKRKNGKPFRENLSRNRSVVSSLQKWIFERRVKRPHTIWLLKSNWAMLTLQRLILQRWNRISWNGMSRRTNDLWYLWIRIQKDVWRVSWLRCISKRPCFEKWNLTQRKFIIT